MFTIERERERKGEREGERAHGLLTGTRAGLVCLVLLVPAPPCDGPYRRKNPT